MLEPQPIFLFVLLLVYGVFASSCDTSSPGAVGKRSVAPNSPQTLSDKSTVAHKGSDTANVCVDKYDCEAAFKQVVQNTQTGSCHDKHTLEPPRQSEPDNFTFETIWHQFEEFTKEFRSQLENLHGDVFSHMTFINCRMSTLLYHEEWHAKMLKTLDAFISQTCGKMKDYFTKRGFVPVDERAKFRQMSTEFAAYKDKLSTTRSHLDLWRKGIPDEAIVLPHSDAQLQPTVRAAIDGPAVCQSSDSSDSTDQTTGMTWQPTIAQALKSSTKFGHTQRKHASVDPLFEDTVSEMFETSAERLQDEFRTYALQLDSLYDIPQGLISVHQERILERKMQLLKKDEEHAALRRFERDDKSSPEKKSSAPTTPNKLRPIAELSLGGTSFRIVDTNDMTAAYVFMPQFGVQILPESQHDCIDFHPELYNSDRVHFNTMHRRAADEFIALHRELGRVLKCVAPDSADAHPETITIVGRLHAITHELVARSPLIGSDKLSFFDAVSRFDEMSKLFDSLARLVATKTDILMAYYGREALKKRFDDKITNSYLAVYVM